MPITAAFEHFREPPKLCKQADTDAVLPCIKNTFDFMQVETISIITIVTSSLSILGSSSIVLAATYNKKILYPEILPIFQLSLADFFASILLLVICCLGVSEREINDQSCDFITGFVTAFYVSTFLLTLAYAMEIYFHVHGGHLKYGRVDASNSISESWREKWKKVTGHPVMYVVYALSWLVPSILALIFSLITSSGSSNLLRIQSKCCMPVFHYDDNDCWSSKGSTWHLVNKLLFIIPLSTVFVLNMVFYILIRRVLVRQWKSQGIFSFAQRQSWISVRNRLIMYQVVFGICWISFCTLVCQDSRCLASISITLTDLQLLIRGGNFHLGLGTRASKRGSSVIIAALILYIVSTTEYYKMANYYWLLILQALFGPLQGFLNSIVYGWRRGKFRQMLTEKTVLVGKTVQSLTASQL